jgi:anti-sigma factor RsiW
MTPIGPSAELDCAAFVELVTEYLEGALPEADLGRLERHLAACLACGTFLEQMRDTVRVAGRLGIEPIRPDALDRLLDVYRAYRGA